MQQSWSMVTYRHYSDTDSEEDPHKFIPNHRIPIQDPEEWSDYWSEELAIVYHLAKEQCDQYGWQILDTCTFAAFVEFCHANSSKTPPKV